MARLLAFIAVVICFQPSRAALSIDDFGAVRNNFSYVASIRNGVALWRALQAANTGTHANDTRRVEIPAGTNYSMLPHAVVTGLNDVTLQLDGTLWAWGDDRSKWPNASAGGAALNFLAFSDTDGLVLTGDGVIEGEGNGWWNGVFDGEPDNRPHLLRADRCSNCVVRGWTLRNSPQYHLLFIDAINTLFEDLTVYVDSAGQAALMRRYNAMSDGTRGIPEGVPIFPLNTDGLDIAGRNLTVRRCNITNYDDALCEWMEQCPGLGRVTRLLPHKSPVSRVAHRLFTLYHRCQADERRRQAESVQRRHHDRGQRRVPGGRHHYRERAA